jgi:Mn-dependent DtxR family transcriptional regulator
LSDQVTDELKQKITEYLSSVDKAKNRDVARAIEVDKALVDKAIAQLANEGKIEYIYLGTSYIKLKGK